LGTNRTPAREIAAVRNHSTTIRCLLASVVEPRSTSAGTAYGGASRPPGEPMPDLPFPDHVRELLAKPNPAVVATLRSDGQPVSVATWYLLEGDRILLNMDRTRVRVKHLRRDPRVTLTVLDEKSWYTHVSLIGRVDDLVDDVGLTDIDRLSVHYNGKPYPDRESPRVTAWMAIDAWHGWGAARS
jgi:PPOX class probable F420-dependent enzyme